MSSVIGTGTAYRGFSRRRPDGTHDATEWAVLFHLPIVPRRRHTLVVGPTTGQYAAGGLTYTTRYRLVRQTPLRPVEILATYLTWWILVPGLALAPLLLLTASGSRAADDFLPVGLTIAWLVAVPVVTSKIGARVRELP